MSDAANERRISGIAKGARLMCSVIAEDWQGVVDFTPLMDGIVMPPEHWQSLVTGGVIAARDGPDLELLDCIVSLGSRGIEALDADDVAARDPLLVGMTLRYLAQGLHLAGQARGDSGGLRRALDAYARSLALITEEREPTDRAIAIYWSAQTLAALGDLDDDAAATQEAVARLREAKRLLAELEDEATWIEIRLELGQLLTQLANAADDDPDMIAEAIAVLEEALAGSEMPRMPARLHRARLKLTTALMLKARKSSDRAAGERAVDLAQAAVDGLDPVKNPAGWAAARAAVADLRSAVRLHSASVQAHDLETVDLAEAALRNAEAELGGRPQ